MKKSWSSSKRKRMLSLPPKLKKQDLNQSKDQKNRNQNLPLAQSKVSLQKANLNLPPLQRKAEKGGRREAERNQEKRGGRINKVLGKNAEKDPILVNWRRKRVVNRTIDIVLLRETGKKKAEDPETNQKIGETKRKEEIDELLKNYLNSRPENKIFILFNFECNHLGCIIIIIILKQADYSLDNWLITDEKYQSFISSPKLHIQIQNRSACVESANFLGVHRFSEYWESVLGD